MIVVGTDEAGRGPLAGPVVAAAVFLDRKEIKFFKGVGLRDSKRLSERVRERLFGLMCEKGVLWAAQAASPERIDRMNILQASLWCMRRSLEKLPLSPDLVVVDGPFSVPGCSFPQKTLIGGDDLVPAVSAASIVAKVLRDRIMRAYAELYPQYGFSRNKGYPTLEHRRALVTYGPSPIHRKTFCVKALKR